MTDAVIIAGVAAVASVIGAAITAILGRRNVHDANRVDEFEATIDGMKEIIAGLKEVLTAQGVRLSGVEEELGTVKTALVTEQKQHSETRELLRIALRHIRDMLVWLGGDRDTEPPAVPDELTHQL